MKAIKTWFLRKMEIWLGEYQWCRRFIGGHWEWWYVDCPINSHVWHKVDRCHEESGEPPTVICRYKTHCEDYTE